MVAVCAAVWLSALFDALHDRSATLAEAQRQYDNIAGALAEQAARALQATDLILQQAALLDPDAPGATSARAMVPDLLRRHMSGVPQVRNLFLFDPQRQLRLSSASSAGSNLDLSDRTYYIAQRDNPDLGLFMSEPFISRVTGDPTFVLSRRLRRRRASAASPERRWMSATFAASTRHWSLAMAATWRCCAPTAGCS